MSKSADKSLVFPWRLRVVYLLVAVVVNLVVFRAVDLHIFNHEFLYHQGEMRNLRVEEIVANRGLIMDREGRPLAVSTPVKSIWLDPTKLQDSPDAWQKLAELSGQSVVTVREKIVANKNRRFVYFKRHITPEVADAIDEHNLPGVYSQTEYRRYYPAGEVASHVVGMTNIDDQGQEGIELMFEDHLKGESGKRLVMKDLLGRVIQDVELMKDAQPGNDLFLSIDLKLQYLAYKELLSAVKKNRAKSGSVVAVDIQTGEILAMVNQPSFNPNGRSKINPESLRNRAITDVFEPGSTMKPFTVAAALEQKKVRPNSPINTAPGWIKIGSKTIRDHRDYGLIDVETVITKSSNVGVTKLALSLEEDLPEVIGRLGFGQPTGVEFPGESSGYFPGRPDWSDLELATLSYGYGLSVTALQLAQSYSVIASGGVRRPLSLLKTNQAGMEERVISESVSNQLVDMLETVVSYEGTASKAQVPGYRVAGKTGTVHKITEQGYADDQYIALFAGLAPATNPRFVVVVLVDDPQGQNYYGGQVAAPAFSKIMSGLLRSMNVPPDDEAVLAESGGQDDAA